MTIQTQPPFGRMLTAMVTPMAADGQIDYEGVRRLAAYLVDEQRNDGLVVSGTTGEAPTLAGDEDRRLLAAVLESVGDRARVVAGAGNNDTVRSLQLARAAAAEGAHGLLVVSPYYNKPPQAGLIRHITAIADEVDLPMVLYDIPGRAGVAIKTETLIELARHPRIVAVKDAKYELFESAKVMAETDLFYYSGADELNLPLLSIGAAGCISVVGHLVGAEIHDMIDAYLAGNVSRATEINARLIPVITGIMTRTQGAIATKAALTLLGLPGGAVRSPLVDMTEEEIARLREDLVAGGVKL